MKWDGLAYGHPVVYHTPIILVPNAHCTVLYPVPFNSLGLIFYACIWSQTVHTSQIVHQTSGMLVPTLYSHPKNLHTSVLHALGHRKCQHEQKMTKELNKRYTMKRQTEN